MEDVITSDLEARGFSAKTGYYLACASRCTYDQTSDLIEKLGLNNKTTFFTCGQFCGLVARLDEATIVAFRGTQNIGNCLTDADTLLVARSPYPGRVHCGFAEAVEQVWPDVRRLLGSPSRTKPLWLTGHSLGAAMATLASVRLTREGYHVRAVYTYGSPRAGDRRFHDSYSLPNYRFVNDNDLIPHLPFRWCYKHVGRLRLVDEKGSCTEVEEAWQAKKQSLVGKAKRVQKAHRHAPGLLHAVFDFDWLADHHLDKYVDAIKKILWHTSERNQLERPDVDMRRFLAPPCRLDSASPAVPAPHGKHRARRRLAISEADLIKAFAGIE
jgi:triacylglycerol lipase